MPVDSMMWWVVLLVAFQEATGDDNGGSWPVLLWPFVAAALRSSRRVLAEPAFHLVASRCPAKGRPEYYDGRDGRLVGRYANRCQVWTAAALLLGHHLLHRTDVLPWLEIEDAG